MKPSTPQIRLKSSPCQSRNKEGIFINTIIKDAFDAQNDIETIRQAAKIIISGGLVAFPTETVYGLGANALCENAVKKIFKAKGRPQDNPLIVHVDSMDMIYPLVEEFDERARMLSERFWPGPLTIIMKRSKTVPDVVSAGLPTVAIRMPSDPIAKALIREAGVPIAAPSANLSGSPSPTMAQHVISDLSGRIDMILNSHSCDVGVESTVISLAGEKPRLLRPGFVTPEELSEILGEIEIDRAVHSSIANDAVVNAPGMKYKHYAPKAPVYVVKGEFSKFCSFVSQKEGIVAMCFDGEANRLSVPCIEYGREGNSQEQASRLFDALRKVDEMGAKAVYARCPECKGVGLAVTNRLFKAAGFEVIEL
ncbi:MAG: L-threonylcarbamoyladenylate synthase [Oscillospiraceae bacterium]|nr:L-threonylcarbamoyladenylate synthase [Oscillospiraceae bacterium]